MISINQCILFKVCPIPHHQTRTKITSFTTRSQTKVILKISKTSSSKFQWATAEHPLLQVWDLRYCPVHLLFRHYATLLFPYQWLLSYILIFNIVAWIHLAHDIRVNAHLLLHLTANLKDIVLCQHLFLPNILPVSFLKNQIPGESLLYFTVH